MQTSVFTVRRGLAMALLFWLAFSASSALGEHLQTEFAHAVQVARQSGKQNLLIFTGIEWDPWSQRFRTGVLLKPDFSEALAKDFVLTHLDLPPMPRPEAESSESEARNYELAREFRLQAIPSILLCTTEGRPYDLVGYEDRDASQLLREIQSKRDAYDLAADRIAALQGPARAKELDAWFQTIPESLRALHPDKMRAIIDSDPGDTTGLLSKYLMAERLPRARQLRYTGGLNEAEKLYREVLKRCRMTGEERQDLHYELADIYFQRKDYDALLDTLEQAIEAAPQGPRMPVLNEMVEVFTRQWIYTKVQPARMRAVGYEILKVTLSADEAASIAELAARAAETAPDSARSRVLKDLIRELRGPGGLENTSALEIRAP